MTRHTTFRFCLDPTVEQLAVLERHVGASRYAYNQCLRFVYDAREARRHDSSVKVPRTGYDLINRFNSWKKSEAASAAEVTSMGTADRRMRHRAVTRRPTHRPGPN